MVKDTSSYNCNFFTYQSDLARKIAEFLGFLEGGSFHGLVLLENVQHVETGMKQEVCCSHCAQCTTCLCVHRLDNHQTGT